MRRNAADIIEAVIQIFNIGLVGTLPVAAAAPIAVFLTNSAHDGETPFGRRFTRSVVLEIISLRDITEPDKKAG